MNAPHIPINDDARRQAGEVDEAAKQMEQQEHFSTPRLLPAQPSCDGWAYCPIRPFIKFNFNEIGCWGERCAAYRAVNATHGLCVLIERSAP